MARLGGKGALVTGAARGIGEAVARRFLAEGACVWLTDLATSGGFGLAGELGPQAAFETLDVREEDDWHFSTGMDISISW